MFVSCIDFCWSGLHLVCFVSFKSCFKTCSATHLDPDSSGDYDRRTPLHLACASGNHGAVEATLETDALIWYNIHAHLRLITVFCWLRSADLWSGVYTSNIESHCHIVWECVINTVPSSQSFLCTEDVSFHRFCCMRKPSIWIAWGSQTSNCCARESRTRKDQALYTSILKSYVKIMGELWRTSQKHGRNWRTWIFSHLFHHVSKSSIFIWSTNPPLHHVFHERSWQFWAHAFDGGRTKRELHIPYGSK